MLFGWLDYAVLEFLATHRESALTRLLVALSVLTQPGCYIAYGLVLTFFTRGQAWLVPVISVVTAVVSTSLKRAFGLPRPELLWQVVAEHNASFPSSHTSAAVAFGYGVMVVYGWRRALPLFAIAAAVAFSRLYLGVHWLSDICGGIAVGAVVAVVIYQIRQRVVAHQH